MTGRGARRVALAVGIAALVSATLAVGQERSDGLRARGEAAFTKQGCHGCHMVGKLGTPIGPDLSYVGRRYSPEYLERWLRDPAMQRPSAHMPALELTDDDIRALAYYLGSLR